LLPALSEVLNIPESAHLWLLTLTVPLAGFALIQGGQRHAGRLPRVLVGIGIGIASLTIGALLDNELAETIVSVAGSLMPARAHILNWRRRHACCAWQQKRLGRRL